MATDPAALRRIVLRPVVTEKGEQQKERQNIYAFQVAGDANRIQVRQAVEKLYSVRVERVNIVQKRGKKRRSRNWRFTKTPDWKKALVKLHTEDKIEFY
jgi:large subunit ribosomal protein L23